ncbi:MAG: TetR/AcrR family transcriptional regulator, partial [Pseudobdellovibrionaceae bacterium]
MKSIGKRQQTKATKEKIIKSALDLFNKKGTAAITTHDIAEAAEISPGNLYYHFKNKEEIIRNIFAEIEIFSEPHWATYGPRNPKVGIMDFMRFFVGNLKRYQFFFREFSRLLQNDPVLAKQWKTTYKSLSEIMRGAVHLWIENGVIKKFSSNDEVNS